MTLRVDGAVRQALVERPTAGAHHRPLVVFLHGARSSPQTARDELAITAQARAAGVLLAFPYGDPATHSWRIGCCAGYADSNADLDFVAALVRALDADGEADPQHVALGGFSVGAYLANSFACTHPELVRGVVAVAGSLAPPPAFVRAVVPVRTRCAPARPVSVLAVVGANDAEAPATGTNARCSSGTCGPGNLRFVPPAATVDAWWRRIDGCSAPQRNTASAAGQARVQLATCRAGTSAGLAVVPGVAHDLSGLRRAFALNATLLSLARGTFLAAW